MLNTLTIAQSLSKSGFKREQAEAIANVVADAAKKERGDLATKDFVRNQINVVRGEISDLRGDMNTLQGDINAKISDLRGDMHTLHGDTNAKISDLRGDMHTLHGDTSAKISDLRGEMHTLHGDTSAKISDLRGEMNSEISRLETRLIRWVVGTGIAVGALVGTAVTIGLSFVS